MSLRLRLHLLWLLLGNFLLPYLLPLCECRLRLGKCLWRLGKGLQLRLHLILPMLGYGLWLRLEKCLHLRLRLDKRLWLLLK